MSAQAYIAGLYPPTNSDIWNANVNWQPVPVHTVPHYLEIKKCPIYENASNKSTEKLYNEFVEANRDTMEYVAEHSGVNIKNSLEMMLIYDTLFIENNYGFEIPEWTLSVFPEPLNNLFDIFATKNAHNDVIKRFGKYIITS